jgi:hypothetical protein
MDYENLTRKQIAELQIEAGSHGDERMAEICEQALDGDPIALQAVADAIGSAKSQAVQ